MNGDKFSESIRRSMLTKSRFLRSCRSDFVSYPRFFFYSLVFRFRISLSTHQQWVHRHSNLLGLKRKILHLRQTQPCQMCEQEIRMLLIACRTHFLSLTSIRQSMREKLSVPTFATIDAFIANSRKGK